MEIDDTEGMADEAEELTVVVALLMAETELLAWVETFETDELILVSEDRADEELATELEAEEETWADAEPTKELEAEEEILADEELTLESDADDEVLELVAEEETWVLEAEDDVFAEEELTLVLEVEEETLVLEMDGEILELVAEEEVFTNEELALVLKAEDEIFVLETDEEALLEEEEETFVLDADELASVLDTDELTLELVIATAELEELTTIFFVYVLNDPILQNCPSNAFGLLATYFLQLSTALSSFPCASFCIGQPDSLYALPAQSPQKLFVKMKRWSLNLLSMSHAPAKCAAGTPNLDVSGDEEVRLEGKVEPRGKNQMLMASAAHSMA
jgi:hypothetical protein